MLPPRGRLYLKSNSSEREHKEVRKMDACSKKIEALCKQ